MSTFKTWEMRVEGMSHHLFFFSDEEHVSVTIENDMRPTADFHEGHFLDSEGHKLASIKGSISDAPAGTGEKFFSIVTKEGSAYKIVAKS